LDESQYYLALFTHIVYNLLLKYLHNFFQHLSGFMISSFSTNQRTFSSSKSIKKIKTMEIQVQQLRDEQQ